MPRTREGRRRLEASAAVLREDSPGAGAETPAPPAAPRGQEDGTAVKIGWHHEAECSRPM